jgi:tetratricopeptide (TPR) repeat protein
MKKTLVDWKLSTPNDSEWLVAAGNYYFNKGLTDSDKKELLQAFPYWKNVLYLNPWRLDVDFDLAQLYQALGEFENQYGFLAQTLLSADKGWRHLQWTGNAKLPKRSSRLIPEYLQAYIDHYFGLHTEEGDEEAHRLAKLSITFYPNHYSTYNSIAVYFSRKKDWARTLKYLLIANLKNPKDSQALCGIGDTLAELGKKKEARIYYQKVIHLNNDGEMVEKAKEKPGGTK